MCKMPNSLMIASFEDACGADRNMRDAASKTQMKNWKKRKSKTHFMTKGQPFFGHKHLYTVG